VQYFGASRAFELADRLERLGQEGNPAGAAELVDRLETEVTRLTEMLTAQTESGETASPVEMLGPSRKPS
jgi:hypothetical protein